MTDACATCATTYGQPHDALTEKSVLPGRDLPCCGRSICYKCLAQNPRYGDYCPYCQISTAPSTLPQGLRDPPAYSATSETASSAPDTLLEHPPPYSAGNYQAASDEKQKTETTAPDVLHFVTPSDSVHSLALAYGVPVQVLRQTNNIFSDHLLQARRTVLISGEYYKGGVSLSPRPIEGEEEEVKKNKIRRWMVTCKVAEYDVAVLYLEQADWNLDVAVASFKEDEHWEQEHPLDAKGKKPKHMSVNNAGMRRFVGVSRTAQT